MMGHSRTTFDRSELPASALRQACDLTPLCSHRRPTRCRAPRGAVRARWAAVLRRRSVRALWCGCAVDPGRSDVRTVGSARDCSPIVNGTFALREQAANRLRRDEVERCKCPGGTPDRKQRDRSVSDDRVTGRPADPSHLIDHFAEETGWRATRPPGVEWSVAIVGSSPGGRRRGRRSRRSWWYADARGQRLHDRSIAPRRTTCMTGTSRLGSGKYPIPLGHAVLGSRVRHRLIERCVTAVLCPLLVGNREKHQETPVEVILHDRDADDAVLMLRHRPTERPRA